LEGARFIAAYEEHQMRVMTVGGWFDGEDLSGPFKTFHAIDEFNPGLANSLVVGPWVHGGWAITDGDHSATCNLAPRR